MKLPILPLLFLLSALTVPCASVDYSDQGSWTGSCNTGTRQSPIDIPCSAFINVCPAMPQYRLYWYDPMTIMGKSSYQDLKTFFTNQNLWALYSNQTNDYVFKSAQFHLHQPSEHTINGKQYPLQMHIVHAISNSNITEYLAVGMFFEVNSKLEYDIFDYARINANVTFNHLFPIPVASKSAYHYKGSLTTPPCLEAVNWFVQTEPIQITAERMTQLTSEIGGGSTNNRHTQSLNGRPVYLVGQGC